MQADRKRPPWGVFPPNKYGGIGTDRLKELKRLQKENERLRRAVSDRTLDKLILAEAAKGNFQAPLVVVLALIVFVLS